MTEKEIVSELNRVAHDEFQISPLIVDLNNPEEREVLTILECHIPEGDYAIYINGEYETANVRYIYMIFKSLGLL
jgi:hypothetical protein